MVCQFLGHPG